MNFKYALFVIQKKNILFLILLIVIGIGRYPPNV